VRALLKQLTVKVKDSRETLTQQHVSNSIYGLQFMSSDQVEVRALLRVLAIKIKECAEVLLPVIASFLCFIISLHYFALSEHIILLPHYFALFASMSYIFCFRVPFVLI
jgi:hypothetical protein